MNVEIKSPGRNPIKSITITDKERMVIKLLSEGYTIAQTASILGKSPLTVKKQKEKLLKKLNARNLHHLCSKSIRYELI